MSAALVLLIQSSAQGGPQIAYWGQQNICGTASADCFSPDGSRIGAPQCTAANPMCIDNYQHCRNLCTPRPGESYCTYCCVGMDYNQIPCGGGSYPSCGGAFCGNPCGEPGAAPGQQLTGRGGYHFTCTTPVTPPPPPGSSSSSSGDSSSGGSSGGGSTTVIVIVVALAVVAVVAILAFIYYLKTKKPALPEVLQEGLTEMTPAQQQQTQMAVQPMATAKFDPNTGQPIVPSGLAVEDRMSKVKELKQMLDSGALTQAEFDAEKKKVLDGPSAHV